jgi:hypothetical protein
VVAVNEGSGATRYREFGRYYGTTGTVNHRRSVSDLTIVDGVPTAASIERLLRNLISIGASADSADISIEWYFGSDYDQMVQFMSGFGDQYWLPWGPNCHTFCNDAIRLSGGERNPFVRQINRRNAAQVALAIRREYERRREEEERRLREEEERRRRQEEVQKTP